ncbi:hypothetical protein CEN40_15535 [Fischerella thermalis CCMEE 5205]|nr:hypothetical protein CEN40_15535 [Fischerella thermalis CCMEE 5205]
MFKVNWYKINSLSLVWRQNLGLNLKRRKKFELALPAFAQRPGGNFKASVGTQREGQRNAEF